MSRFANKVVVVTGATSGIGLETAGAFAAEGARVFLTGRRAEELDTAVRSIGKMATGVPGDVSRLSDLEALATQVKKEAGRVDVLFANAGVGELASLLDATEEHFDKQFAVNVKGVFFTVQKLVPLMPPGSSIVLNASIAGVKGMDAFSAYCATKAAVRSLARSWTVELQPRGIRVNVVSPGPIATPIFGKMGISAEEAAQFGENVEKQVPMQRMGRPEEVAAAVLFLASDQASYITGVDLAVDGGMAQV